MFRVVVPCLFVGAILYCICLHPVFFLTSAVSLDTRQACFPLKVHLNILLLIGSDGAPRIVAVSLLDENKVELLKGTFKLSGKKRLPSNNKIMKRDLKVTSGMCLLSFQS